MKERTLFIIKPDATARHLTGEILRRIESAGFHIAALQMRHLTTDEALKFYDVHKDKEFYHPLVEFMTSGACVAAVLEHENAVEQLRKIVGKTDPAEAEAGTIRYDFGETIRRNSVHASDSQESAQKEIEFFFGIIG